MSQGRIKFYYGISPSLSSRTKSYEILSFNHHHLHPHAIRQLGAFVLHSLCRCSLSASPPCPHRSSSRSSKVSNPLARFFVHSLTSEEGKDDKGVGGWVCRRRRVASSLNLQISQPSDTKTLHYFTVVLCISNEPASKFMVLAEGVLIFYQPSFHSGQLIKGKLLLTHEGISSFIKKRSSPRLPVDTP